MSQIPDPDCDELSDQEAANPGNLALQSKKLQKLQEAYKKRGIVYVSRIPPHMVRLCSTHAAVSADYTLTCMDLNCRNLKNCASCWSNMVLLADSIARLKVGSRRTCIPRPAYWPRLKTVT